jgi:hypothetical protein
LAWAQRPVLSGRMTGSCPINSIYRVHGVIRSDPLWGRQPTSPPPMPKPPWLNNPDWTRLPRRGPVRRRLPNALAYAGRPVTGREIADRIHDTTPTRGQLGHVWELVRGHLPICKPVSYHGCHQCPRDKPIHKYCAATSAMKTKSPLPLASTWRKSTSAPFRGAEPQSGSMRPKERRPTEHL